MTLKLSQNEFDVLITLLDEALQMISLKNFYNIEIDEKYDFYEYDRIRFYKMRESVTSQKLRDKEKEKYFIERIHDTRTKDSYIKLCKKISKNRKIDNSYMQEVVWLPYIMENNYSQMTIEEKKKFLDILKEIEEKNKNKTNQQ